MPVVNEKYDVLIRLPRKARKLGALCGRSSERIRLFTEWAKVGTRRERELLVVSTLGELANEQGRTELERLVGRRKRFVLFVDEMPTKSLPDLVFDLKIRSKTRLHVANLPSDELLTAFLRRLLSGLGDPNDSTPIVDAWWEGDTFVVMSPEFERLRIPLDALPKAVNTLEAEDRERFEIDEFGDFVSWPTADVHVGWSQFLQAIDPIARLRAEQKSVDFNRRFGRAIRAVREAHDLRQNEIPGLTDRTIRRIEHGRTRATSAAIKKLAQAHQMTPGDYLAQLIDAGGPE